MLIIGFIIIKDTVYYMLLFNLLDQLKKDI